MTVMLRRLADSLRVDDLSQINEDLLKQLYQDLVDPETRHELGEFYTPDWLAELTLEEIGYQPGQSLMDPSCGAGTFLFLAIRRLAAQGLTGWALVDFRAGRTSWAWMCTPGRDHLTHQLSAGDQPAHAGQQAPAARCGCRPSRSTWPTRWR